MYFETSTFDFSGNIVENGLERAKTDTKRPIRGGSIEEILIVVYYSENSLLSGLSDTHISTALELSKNLYANR